ncbi:DUF7095 family protein [Halolamina salifodinae]|uniref:Uncharacterized protein n=1 Tax=Halolamina salifodinae TaxID=1202767 RepID=A0A8T4GZ12_9EURY|nr:hypothetical protein [Halolamina salifodinae]MBP1986358.1 hypothetical protein [Halolamina salifodinae]
MERAAALDRVEALLDTIETEPMPVPVREVWLYGDAALGLDPVERLDIYLTKDILLESDDEAAERFEREYGVKGVGSTVRAEWAEQFPDSLRASENGYAAPEKCLGAHLTDTDEPIHLEVCNASFGDNVTQRLRGALDREAYEQVLDPRGACLWEDGERDAETLEKLRAGDLAFPTLSEALGMLGADEADARVAAEAVNERRAEQTGVTVRGDVV